jgi:hypothetical protein
VWQGAEIFEQRLREISEQESAANPHGGTAVCPITLSTCARAWCHDHCTVRVSSHVTCACSQARLTEEDRERYGDGDDICSTSGLLCAVCPHCQA